MMCSSRLINERALALERVFHGKYQSKITTLDGIYYSEMLPRELLNKACMRYGATKRGRVDTAKLMLRFLRKPPFMISHNEIAVFPIMSPDRDECIWIFNHRFEVEEVRKSISRITFWNGTTIVVPRSKHTILRQEQRLYTLLGKNASFEREKKLYIA